MFNLVSYCLNYGSISFKDEPLNEVDALIFSRLSYVEFSSFVTNTKFKKISLIKLLNKLLSFKDKSKYFHLKEDMELFTLISKQERYKHLYLYRNITKFDKESLTQFGAITLINKQYKAKFIVCSFKGTDGTIVGWKEDFKLALSNINAQNEAYNYLKKSLPLLKRTNCFIVGHSKGGNLAIYSSSLLSKKEQNKINKIYAFDSPGFKKDFYEQSNFKNIEDKIGFFAPTDSIIGRLLIQNYNINIVKSLSSLLNQHNLYNWEINEKSIVKAPSFSKLSDKITLFINSRIETTSSEDLDQFIEKIFSILERQGDGIHLKKEDDTLSTLFLNLLKELVFDKESRKLLIKFLKKN